MIAAMINDDTRGESILLVVIEKENLDRMKEADPISLESYNSGGILPPPDYPDRLVVLIAYEEDEVELYKMARAGDNAALVRWLARGFKFKRGLDGTENAFKLHQGKKK
jgi:hypothetical protein